MLAVVVAITVLLVALIFSLTYLVEPLPSEAEKVVDGATVILGDVVWKDRTGILERPVRVQDGGRLRLVDCDIQVMLEDMVFSRTDWFTVLDGGVLEMERSTVTIVSSGDPYSTYYFDVDRSEDEFFRYGPPFFHRVVNLRDTSDPLLYLEYNGWSLDGTVHVAIQPSPDEPMEPLAALNVSSKNGNAWFPLEVPLTRYAGSIVRVAVFPQSPNLRGMMFRGVVVSDGSDELPWDDFHTGDLVEDGWQIENMDLIAWEMAQLRWGNLVVVEGGLVLRDSTLSSPTLPREWRNWEYGAMKTIVESWDGPYNTRRTDRGGGVVLWDGSLIVEGSTLENVSVVAEDTSIQVRDSELVSDREVVTLCGCEGSIERTLVRSIYGPESDYDDYEYIDEPFLWALSLWNSTGDNPFRISECVFQDSVMGIDLAHSNVQVTGCTFRNCSYLAIWDHETEGMWSWEGLNSSNRFIDCNASWYLRTHDCRIDFQGPNRPFRDFEFFETGGDVVDIDEGELLIYDLLWTDSRRADMYMPTLMVNGSGVVSQPTWVEVELTTEWGGDVWMRVDTFRTEQSAYFDGKDLFPDDDDDFEPAPPHLTGPQWGMPSPGIVNVSVGISYSYWDSSGDYPLAHDLELAVFLDEKLEELVYPKWEATPYSYRTQVVTVDLALEPGVHDLYIELNGFFMNSTEPSVFDTMNDSIAMVDASTPTDEVLEWMLAGLQIVLERGTHLVIEDIGDEHPIEDWLWASMILPEDTTVTIRNITLAAPPYNSVGLDATGPGGIILEDIDATILYLYLFGTRARLSNVTALVSEMYSTDSVIEFDNVTIDPYWWNFEHSTVEVLDSRIPCDNHNTFYAAETNLTIRDTELIGNSTELMIYSTNLTMVDVTVRDLNVTVIGEYDGRIEIEGCDFLGSPAFLFVKSDYSDVWDPSWFFWNDVRGNTFWGHESGLVGKPWLVEGLLQMNQLMDGAKSFVWIRFEFNLDPVDPDLYYHDFLAEPVSPKDPRVIDLESIYGHNAFVYRVLMQSDGTGTVADPPLVPFIVYHDDHARDSPVWFIEVDPTADTTTFSIPDWGDPYLEIIRILREGSDSTWWVGGP